MVYSVSARQSQTILTQAEEIKVDYKDVQVLFDYEAMGLSEKKIVVKIPRGEIVDWELLKSFQEKMNLTLCLEDLGMGDTAFDEGFHFFWEFAAATWYDLRGLIRMGVSEVLITIPLTFDLPQVRNIVGPDVKIRMVCNLAFENYLVHSDGICGSYVRPEDVPLYEQYVDIMEFGETSLSAQAAVFNIYHNDQKWPGNLNLLIRNLNYDVDNRIIPPEFAENRIKCGQICQRSNSCHLCLNIMKYLTNVDKNRFDWDFETHQWKESE